MREEPRTPVNFTLCCIGDDLPSGVRSIAQEFFFKVNIFSPSAQNRWIAPSKWDKQLYASLFGTPLLRPMRFSCTLAERCTEFSNTLQPAPADGIHTYLGAIELQLEADKSCTVHVQIRTSRSSEQFDVPINAHRLGHMHFDVLGVTPERPALMICLRDDGGGAEALAQLFLEARLCGHAGPSFSWAADLTSLENSSALDIWGTWAGTRDLPGRRPFTISDYHFSVGQQNAT